MADTLVKDVAASASANPTASERAADPDVVLAYSGLGLVGRVLLGAGVLAGLGVAALSGFALFWYIPYAAVASVLIVRLPRHRIGWILLAMAWVHALLVLPIRATADQFDTGAPPLVALTAVLTTLAAGLILPLYGLLAFGVPSGRLPTGGWGTIARIALTSAVLAEALLFFAPMTVLNLDGESSGVLVRNPIALAPDLPIWQWFPREVTFVVLFGLLISAAASLIVRMRRSRGIERQQLRWIGTSLTLVVSTFLFAVLIPVVFPDVEQIVILPVVLSFATVPVAIGVGVMRYRLYEIDTVINRAIVYGLLTAILAGGSAAAIGLIQSLFVGVLGPGSTVTIVVTTLLVVSAFNPIKARLQAIVDRRFKPAPDPETSLRAFIAEVRGSLSKPDRERTFERLLGIAVPELATAAELRWTRDGGEERVTAAGAEVASLPVVVRASVGGTVAEMRLAGVSALRAQEPLHQALIAVLEETRSAAA